MKHKTVLLVSSDQEYNMNIEEQLAASLGDNVQLELITDSAYLSEYLQKPHKVDVLIEEEHFVAETAGAVMAGMTFQLTEETGTEGNHISKYGGTQAIVRMMDQSFLKEDGTSYSRETKLIDICSVSGGSGKTVTALGVAKRLGEMGRKVLYICSCSFQDFYSLLPCEAGEEQHPYMSQVLLRAMTDRPQAAADAALAEIVHGVFDYVPQVEKLPSAYQIKDVSYYAIADEIRNRQIYDYILMEYDNRLTGELMARLMQGERLLITSLQSRGAVQRLERFASLIGTNAQGIVVCGRYIQEHSDYLGSSAVLRQYPLSERIPEKNREEMLQELLEDGVFRQTAEAML